MSPPIDPPALSKAERLAIGAAVAAPVRQQAKAPRKVTLVGKDGKPVGTTTSTEVAKSLLARSEIEFSVQEGKRPRFVTCDVCGLPVKVPANGKVPKRHKVVAKKCKCGKRVQRAAGSCAIGEWCPECSPMSEEEMGAELTRLREFAKSRGFRPEWADKVLSAKLTAAKQALA